MTVPSALRRKAVVLAVPGVACLTVAALAAPAAAARPDSSSSTRSGVQAFVQWTEHDPMDVLGLPGNTHVGSLDVEDGAFGTFAFGKIFDLECGPGQVPGGSHGGPGTCEHVGVRVLQGEDVDLVATATSATLSGTLEVSNGGHGGPGSVVNRVPATVTWTSSTGLSRYRASNSYSDGSVTYRSRTSGLRSDPATTTVTGSLGRMGFADDPDDVSVGAFQTYTETWRERMR